MMNLRSAVIIACCILGVSKVQAQTVSTFDVLVATGNLTVSGTTTITGDSVSVGVSTLVVSHGWVGIGTTTPLGVLHVVQHNQGTNKDIELLMWHRNVESSLLFGLRTLDYWDYYNVGARSVALGGASNLIRGDNSGIIGGESNFNYASDSFMGGGFDNTIDSRAYAAQAAAIIGGDDHLATGNGSLIAGGAFNSVDRTGSAVIGGSFNIATGTGSVVIGGTTNLASGHYSGILGGVGNIASGNYSFAGGNYANAAGRGSFVWADSQSTEFKSSVNDEFKIRSKGGFVFYASTSAATVVVSSGSIMISTSATAAGAVPNLYISSSNGNVGIGTTAPSSALHVVGSIKMVDGNQGSGKVLTSDANGVGSWTTSSSPFASSYDSGDLTITLSSTSSQAHGLGGTPKLVTATIICRTAELGYSVGDEVQFLSREANGYFTAPAFYTSTNVGVVLGNAINLLRKDTQVITGITPSNWRLILRAWR